MIKNLFYMTLLAVVTLSISYLMFPREKEIGLMQLKSRDYDSAQVSFEEQLANGDVSISVVGPLSEIYLHKGEIDRSIAVLEKFLDGNPDHITGLRRLAQYFKEAQRPNGQVRTLSRLAELEENPAILRELAGRHGLLVNEGAQAEVLARLVNGGNASVEEYDRLARHQAAKGQLSAATDTLHALVATHGQDTPSESIELLVGLLLDLGNAQGAAEVATRSLETAHENGFAESLASQFAERRRPDLAIRLLRPVIEKRPDDVTLVSAAIQYEALTGNTSAALRRLQNYAHSHPLPDNLSHDLVVLLLAEHNPKEALKTFRSLKAERIPGWLVSALVTNASEHQWPYLIENLSTFLGDSYLTRDPILAAEIALAKNELDEVNIWIEWAESEPHLPYRDRLVLVRLYQNVQRPNDAMALLRKLTDEGVGKSAEISALGDVYLTTDRAFDGQSVFDVLRRSHPSTDMDSAWARLAAKTKRAGAVFRWINSTPVIASATLEDIFRFAELNRQPALSLAAAERLRTAYPTVKSRRLHARALAANGYAEDATQGFDKLIDDGVRLDNDDLAILSQIGATDQLDRYWANREALGSGTEKSKLATLFAGARRAAAQLVLPRFEKLARSNGGFWFDTFAETARLAGEMPRLKKYLKAEAERTDLTPKETRQIATTLFDVSPVDSLNLYARMVRKDPDAWGDDYIETLMALGRTQKLVNFLATEIDRPNISDTRRDSRLYALVETGGPAAAEAPLRRLAKTEGGEWEYAYEETLVSLGKEQTLYDFLATKADQQELDTEERNGIAFRLLEAVGRT
jgi:tetratricopeptide (TPR) repeat protein